MTAEIALLNRRALAFAADSAVTISDGTKDKIYNSAEKLFELSRKVPLGLMLYNTTEFLGVPLDVLSRQFRADCDEKFTTARDACGKLVSYLNKFDHSIEDEGAHLRSILHDEFDVIARESRKEIQTLTKTLVGEILSGNTPATALPDASKVATIKVIQRRIARYESSVMKDFLPNETLETFQKQYGDFVEAAVSAKFQQLAKDPEIGKETKRLAWAMVKSSIMSGYLTGLIVGGYGDKCLFPKLYTPSKSSAYNFGNKQRHKSFTMLV